jgi:Ni/Co efflux regulator RcnB
MKKTLLSLVAVSAIATTGALADSATDIAELKAMMAEMNKRLAKLEAENRALKAKAETDTGAPHHASHKTHRKHHASAAQGEKIATLEKKVETLEKKSAKETAVFSKVPKLKFSGKHYLGFVADSEKDRNKFETRRNYLQLKGYFGENLKDYFRITLDTFQNTKGTGKDYGSWEVRLKYAYLYLDDVLPFTGVEIGQAHRPWIDYEEHHGWNYRSISKVLVEAHDGAHFTNSADLGIDFKTKTDYFSSELGIFNGEGYHGDASDNEHLSGEWRLTAHLLGTGKKHVHKHDTYADVSFFGQYNTEYKEGQDDFIWYGAHAVYNQPEFLLAAQYVKATDGGVKKEGDGWSVNGEFRLDTLSAAMHGWNLLGRYDSFDLDAGEERERTIAGVAYQYNKYVEFVANYLNEQVDGEDQTDALMLTAEVNW